MSDRPWTDADDRGPPISAERKSILSFIDDRIARLRGRARSSIDEGRTAYGAQILEALRGDLRQELDRADAPAE